MSFLQMQETVSGSRRSATFVVGNLRRYFLGLPDVEALAQLSGQPAARPAAAPLFLDGKLDYSGLLTGWRGAVER